MIRQSMMKEEALILLNDDKKRLFCIGNFVLAQCVIIIFAGFTVVECVWKPQLLPFDPYKLASIMYLYDRKTCEDLSNVASKAVVNLRFSNDSKGYDVLAYKYTKPIVTVTTRLSNKTRTYIEISMAIHLIWIILTLLFQLIINQNQNAELIYFAIKVYFSTFIFVSIFDLSMAIVYVAHIKQALTKGMIVRYSGWSVEFKLKNYEDFAGYLPLLAAACWIKGVVILGFNLYYCKILNLIRNRLKRTDCLLRFNNIHNKPFPEPKQEESMHPKTLYYRPGEDKPYVRKNSYAEFFTLNKVLMNTLGIWSLLAIFYQTFFCIVISWLTLGCKLSPEATELAEVTLMKLLYLYEPEACGRIHFYNYTTLDAINGAGTAVVWPVKNEIAGRFRRKIKIWLTLHVFWMVLAVVNISQGSRPCSYYVTLLPFTLAGIGILVVDVAFCALFLVDAVHTRSEAEILDYINADGHSLQSINVTLQRPANAEDTSWISVILAYSSIRGIVQWIVNFWIVKDSYFNGLAVYHRLRQQSFKGRTRAKSVQLYRVRV